jgi:hypothetical protein
MLFSAKKQRLTKTTTLAFSNVVENIDISSDVFPKGDDVLFLDREMTLYALFSWRWPARADGSPGGGGGSMHLERDYWDIAELSSDASELADLLARGQVDEVEAGLLRMAKTADLSGFASLAMASQRAARTLAIEGISGALGAELMTLGDELRLFTGPEQPA